MKQKLYTDAIFSSLRWHLYYVCIENEHRKKKEEKFPDTFYSFVKHFSTIHQTGENLYEIYLYGGLWM